MEPPAQPDKGDDPCRPRCLETPDRWAIPAGILNSLWCDIFPRLVARAWYPDAIPPMTSPPPILQRGTTAPRLLEVLKDLQTAWTASPHLTTSLLKGRLDEVVAFFTTYPTFPFRVSGDGGYDFLLSDWGVEFFMPDMPADDRHLLKYFLFRQPGRPSIGIPGYLTASMSLLSVDAPTGPGQVLLDPEAPSSVLSAFSECPDVQVLLDQMAARVTTAKRRFMTKRGIGSSTQGVIEISLEEYMCALRPFRCWQVEGAVYRGIAGELPRIVADAWIEILDEVPDRPKLCRTRFGRRTNDGLREIFEERLETSLPNDDRMVFSAVDEPVPVPANWGNDLWVTNRGFFFPQLPPKPPDLESMLTDIVQGRAGNPVFTDSKRPDRGG